MFSRFCVGDRFYLCDNKILCESDYNERIIFSNSRSAMVSKYPVTNPCDFFHGRTYQMPPVSSYSLKKYYHSSVREYFMFCKFIISPAFFKRNFEKEALKESLGAVLTKLCLWVFVRRAKKRKNPVDVGRVSFYAGICIELWSGTLSQQVNDFFEIFLESPIPAPMVDVRLIRQS